MTTPGILRLKFTLAQHGRSIAIVFAVIGLVAVGGSANAALNPPTAEVTERTDVQSVTSETTIVAVVSGDSALWDEGTRLEGAPFYPLEAAPEPELRARTTVPSDQPVDVSHRISVVYRATRDGETMWESTEVLADEDRTVYDGQATVTAPLDIDSIQSQTAAFNDELTGVSRVNVLVRLNVSYTTDRYTGQVTKTAPVTISGTGYWLDGDLDFVRDHSTPVTREITQPPDRGVIAGFGVVGLFSWLVGLGAFWYGRRASPAALKHELDRARCFEWISTGRIRQPMSGQDVAIESLEDLVDVAIDSNRRVIHDVDRELYAVFDENLLYYFDPVGGQSGVDVEPIEEEDGGTVQKRVRSDGAGDDGVPSGSATDPAVTDDRDAWDRLMDDYADDLDDRS